MDLLGTLVLLRPDEWFPPFLGFGIVLVGLVWFGARAIGHGTTTRDLRPAGINHVRFCNSLQMAVLQGKQVQLLHVMGRVGA